MSTSFQAELYTSHQSILTSIVIYISCIWIYKP